MTNRNEHLLDWLRDAHAMEHQAETMLKGQASRLEHYPDLRARIEQHLEETVDQKAAIDSCIQRLGGSSSALKDVGGKLAAFGQAAGGMVMSDEVIKGSMAGYVFENIEIAMYTVLIEAATAAGDEQTRKICEDILQQEKAMATWILHNLPSVTIAFLTRSEQEADTAKR